MTSNKLLLLQQHHGEKDPSACLQKFRVPEFKEGVWYYIGQTH